MMKLVGVSDSDLAAVGVGEGDRTNTNTSATYTNSCCQHCGLDPEVFPLVRKKVAKFVAAYKKEKGNVKKLLEVVEVYESMEKMMALCEKEQQSHKYQSQSSSSRAGVSSVFGMVDSEYVSDNE